MHDKECERFEYTTRRLVRETQPGDMEAMVGLSSIVAGTYGSPQGASEVERHVLFKEMIKLLKERYLSQPKETTLRKTYRRQFLLFKAMYENGADLNAAIELMKKTYDLPDQTYRDDWNSIVKLMRDWATRVPAPRLRRP